MLTNTVDIGVDRRDGDRCDGDRCDGDGNGDGHGANRVDQFLPLMLT